MKLTSIAVLAVFLTSAAHGAEKPSQALLKKPIEGSFAEIQMGRLAQQKGHSDNFSQTPRGRSFGRQPESDRRRAVDRREPARWTKREAERRLRQDVQNVRFAV